MVSASCPILLLVLLLFILGIMALSNFNIYSGSNTEYNPKVIDYKGSHFIDFVVAKTSSANTNATISAASTRHNTSTVTIKPGSGQKAGVVPLEFDPNELFIKSGDKVVWVNKDVTNHSVTSLAFNSGIIRPTNSSAGRSTYSYVFSRPGTFVYVDRLHPYMGGVIYVDVPASQRELISTTGNLFDVKVEMPQNAAYQNNYGPYFIPATVTVPQKAKVTWTNKDYVAHTATSGDGGVAFDTKTILPGESLTLSLNLAKGAYSYYCKIHPWMLGNLVVS